MTIETDSNGHLDSEAGMNLANESNSRLDSEVGTNLAHEPTSRRDSDVEMTLVNKPRKSRKNAEVRKWYARAWWIAFHVYDYSALTYAGVLAPSHQGIGNFIVVTTIALINLSAYITLQRSSPGYVDVYDLEYGRKINQSESNATDVGHLHFCEECQIMQPLRTKHCKDCSRCVRQYDHHCDCAGTCVGQLNRRHFILYLFIQVIEGMWMIGAAASAFTLQDSIDMWFRVNWPFLIVWISLFCTLLIAIPLLCYQLFLITTNQTSWEHARRSNITYLMHLRGDTSPFDQGCVQNWRIFVCGGDSNRWVHSSKTHIAVSMEDEDLSIM